MIVLWSDCIEKLNETELPPRENFYSSLYDTKLSEEEYQFAQAVWSAFKINNLFEYAELYMKIYTLLLAQVFESFRDQCMDSYGLDPAHYYTSPGLSWDATLKMADVNLELLLDIDQILFTEAVIHGGISQASNRYAKANNLYMEEYDPNEETKYLMYIDASNLYG